MKSEIRNNHFPTPQPSGIPPHQHTTKDNSPRNLKYLWLSLLAIFFMAGMFYPIAGMNYRNQEAAYRTQFGAQTSNMKVVNDNMWKILSQQAQVTTQHRNTFEKMLPYLLKGNYGNAQSGPLTTFFQQTNLKVDTRMFEKLSDSIEVQRTIWTREQQKAIDIKREHDNLRTQTPSSWFVGHVPELELKLVTSTQTEQSFETGKDDNVSLFGKE